MKEPPNGLKFQVGMKLEAIDPLNLSAICVATVMKVLCLTRDVIYKWLLFVKRPVMVSFFNMFFKKPTYLLMYVNMKVKFWEY